MTVLWWAAVAWRPQPSQTASHTRKEIWPASHGLNEAMVSHGNYVYALFWGLLFSLLEKQATPPPFLVQSCCFHLKRCDLKDPTVLLATGNRRYKKPQKGPVENHRQGPLCYLNSIHLPTQVFTSGTRARRFSFSTAPLQMTPAWHKPWKTNWDTNFRKWRWNQEEIQAKATDVPYVMVNQLRPL